MTTTVERTVDQIADLLERGLAAGTSMLDSLAGSSTLSSLQARLPRATTCSCHIPPPCWMPREHGPVTTHVCAGGTATLRLRITNCSIETSTVSVEVKGPGAANVKVAPASLSLSPLERGIVALSLATNATDAKGTEHETLVWIHGCVEHVVHWTVKVAGRGGHSCQELDLDDCPDYVHHWYDHFYCARPCRHAQSSGVVVNVRG
jgi:hypothetical protein